MDLDKFARRFGKHREAEPADAPDAPAAGPQEQPAAATPADDIGDLPSWLEAREERAAIMEHDGGLSRDEAERRAALLHPDPDETRPEWRGFTAADLMEAAGPDWCEVADRPEVLQALALALALERSQREPSDAPDPTPKPSPAVRVEPVTCGTCKFFRPNLISPAAGIGYCGIEAPASRHPPSLWPNGKHYCRDWQSTNQEPEAPARTPSPDDESNAR